VVQDIRDVLCLDSTTAPCLMGTFNRPNISYEVRYKDSLNATTPQGAMHDLINAIKEQHDVAEKAKQPCSGIIYVHKREDCTTLAIQISKTTGLVAAAYHAGLKDAEREDTQQKWTAGSVHVAVATVAFGMGIDLPHVRYVVHWSLAKSLEGFYQESGRAGRDGKPSISILYYSKDDASKFAFLLKKNAEKAAQKSGARDGSSSQKLDHSLVELERMTDYCTKPCCKRQYVLGHFGEKIEANVVCKKTCDYCQNPSKVESDIQASECMGAVVNSQRLLHQSKHSDEKPFHHNPLESDESQDDDSEYNDFLDNDDGLLQTTDYIGKDDLPSGLPPKKGFVKASSVLNKYQSMECQAGKKGGFVNFKTRTFDDESEDRDAKRNRPVVIPEHLRKNMPDPLAASYNKSATSSELKTGSSYASEVERLKAEIETLQKAKAEALAKMKADTSRSSALSAPSLSFKKRRY